MRGETSPSTGSGPNRRAIFRYGLAVACVAAGVFLAEVLRPVLDAAVLLLAAVLIAAWFSGLWPALLASILATLALDYYFTPPLYSLTLELAHIRVAIFTLLAAFFASASAARRRAEHSLKRARDDMEARVRERTAELEQSNQQLQEEIRERRRAEEASDNLAGRLITAQEEERRRIGRELHDHISQMLGVLTIKLDQLRADPGDPAAIASALDRLREDARDIADDVHRLSHRLHSSTLDFLGLGPALQKLVSEFSARHEIAVSLSDAKLPVSPPPEVALCLFRIVEEALANIGKHSHARSARVEVTGDIEAIHLIVEDAGVGFDTTRLQRRAGLGFVSMQERLRILRGTIRVDSAPSRGTTITVSVPATRVATAARDAAQGTTAAAEFPPTVSPA
jgi:two-component system, NarL family, sensor kinase